ncbi:trypsin [Latimeria chalumnae]|uniref:trypsin n=1 Tax=Latimeria chalumnae TaxID=7897 RepID=UPI0003C17186|nr:PREDICTED: trypsin-like [Latimeria chalumnae]|eukprot:XP_005988765.1 PREDICTED: trypsin-like [Latimeria chalumnae]
MFLFCSAGQENINQRIIGGYVTAPYSIKYIVSLKTERGKHFCGGSLISRCWVVTAAHCKAAADQMMIVAGEHSLSALEGTEQHLRPARLYVHPRYNPATKDADIMLIKLRKPALLNRFVSIVALPHQRAVLEDGMICRVSGWGYADNGGGVSSNKLRSVKVPVVPVLQCNSSGSYDGLITANMICAGYGQGGKDACQGDSGGPLTCEGRLFGIVSWGRGCAEAKFPGVYTEVAKFRKWIHKIVFHL